ncbi:hypothetical protein CVT26_003737 [Gymnopilus dilepis]|uniref:PH domain-containing protein n=1 Tax=Gymnopilus dilepis TaxID=231916 RepID=A0A409YXF8_9AGAR|nr:hypothetical protein CVT26_003737 [Gymnopilus dilepis]
MPSPLLFVMHPQTPAQRLIAQYERLSTPPPNNPKSTYARHYPSAKDKSPLRNSLRNLLSVFRKPIQVAQKKHAGSLLYLSPSLAWLHCAATLDAGKLILTGDVDLEIALSDCTDIRSLSPSKLTIDDTRLLPDASRLTVFEILFSDSSTQKFAASSVRERAGWISAIWFGCRSTAPIFQEVRSKRNANARSGYAYHYC